MSNVRIHATGGATVLLTAAMVVLQPNADNQRDAIRASLDRYCIDCHNDIDLAGDIDFTALDAGAIHADVELWETAVRKLRAGEMPPPEARNSGTERDLADAELATLAQWIDTGVGSVYDALPVNPGRVTARRLNRVEYENTIRDLLDVDFVAGDQFPADDTVLGFDNNAEVLTVSPLLTRQYLTAAEKIAARAIGGSPLPLQGGFFSRDDRLRQIDINSVELTEVLDYDAEYLIQIELEGNRGADDPPVDLVVSVDGEPVFETSVAVQKGSTYAIGGNTQRLHFETRVFMTAARHTIRADFVNDTFAETLPESDYRNDNRNIYPNKIRVAGPYPAANPPEISRAVLSCDIASGRVCVESILTDLAPRAFRRPVADSELAGFLAIYDQAEALGFSASESLQHAISAVLVSPHFLFRYEAEPAPGTHAPISDYELASRLSYFLWRSMPDDALFAAAARSELNTTEQILTQIERMLDDPKAQALSEQFTAQWLETRSLDAISRDRALYPEWNNALALSMATETELFFAHVLAENRPISDFIDGPYTFIDGRLARHYGIDGVDGEDFVRVDLTTPERSGIFTHASVLTVTSYPNRTSVVLRGKYLLDNVLSAPPPGPPADVPGLNEAALGTEQTLREQMQAHRANPTCASCHVRMDPLGFGLENYDATGKWRTMDGSFPVNSSAELPNGRAFNGPAELKLILGDNLPDFAHGLTEKLFTFAMGRGIESTYDRKILRDIVEASAADGYRLRTLIAGIAMSEPFRQQSAPAASELQE